MIVTSSFIVGSFVSAAVIAPVPSVKPFFGVVRLRTLLFESAARSTILAGVYSVPVALSPAQ